MNKDKEFDDYIKGFFDKDPEVPSELDWEAMDFDLPKPEIAETKEETGNKYKKYLLLLLLLLTAVIGFLNFNKNQSNNTAQSVLSKTDLLVDKPKAIADSSAKLIIDEPEATTNSSSELMVDNDAAINGHTEKHRSIESKVNTEEVQTGSTNDTSNELGALKTQSQLKEGEKSGKNSVQKELELLLKDDEVQKLIALITDNEQQEETNKNTNSKPISTNEASAQKPLERQAKQPNTSANIVSSIKQNETKKHLAEKDIKTGTINIKSSHTIKKHTEDQSTNNQLSPLSPISLNSLPIPLSKKIDVALIESYPIEKESNSKTQSKAIEIFAGYGYNIFNLNVAESNPIKENLNSDFGKSFTSGIRFDISNFWQTTLQIKYDQYHSTFEYARDLEPIYNLIGFSKVHRQELTFHNNYTNTLGIQLGVARRFNLSKLNFYTGIGIAPTYTLSTKGKTLNDNNVNTLIYDKQINRLSVSGNLNLRMTYALNPSLNLEMVYQHNRFLSAGPFINNGSTTKQQNALFLIISYRLNR